MTGQNISDKKCENDERLLQLSYKMWRFIFI